MLKKVKVAGTDLSLWCEETSSGSANPPLFFLHGSGGDYTSWQEQIPAFSGRRNLFALDLPGHGRSEGEAETDVFTYATWVRKTCEELNLVKPVLIGHSLGAAVCLAAACRAPADFSALVLVGGAAKFSVDEKLLIQVDTNPAEAISLVGAVALAKRNRERLSPSLILQLSRARPGVLYRDLLACSRFDLTGSLAILTMPVLVVCGLEDRLTPPDLSRYLKDNIPRAELKLLPNTGHFPMREEPEEFNRMLWEFLKTQDVDHVH